MAAGEALRSLDRRAGPWSTVSASSCRSRDQGHTRGGRRRPFDRGGAAQPRDEGRDKEDEEVDPWPNLSRPVALQPVQAHLGPNSDLGQKGSKSS